jgi:predicted transcriptional regulator
MNEFDMVTMTPEEFKDWCKKHSLSVENAGTVLGVYRATAYKYANGDLPIGKTILIAMKLFDLLDLDTRKSVFDQLLKAYALQKKSK